MTFNTIRNSEKNKSIKTKFFQFHDKKGNQINLSQNSESYQNGIFLGFSDWDGRYSRNSIKSFENPVQGKCITKKIGSFNNCKNGVCIEDFQIINKGQYSINNDFNSIAILENRYFVFNKKEIDKKGSF